MASVYDAVAALQVMGLELKALGDEAERTTGKAREAARAVEEGRKTESGITSDPTSTIEQISTTSLGDAGNAENQMIKLYQAIEAAKRGR